MEIKCHLSDPEFEIRLEKLLDSLAKLYSLDTEKFLEVWKNMPQAIRTGITSTAANSLNFENTKYEDLSDYCLEVVNWFRTEYSLLHPKNKPFTLRNPDDLKQFEEFLDRMLHLLKISPAHFILILEQCPLAYWDKIDDLRETSYKLKRDSIEYLRCLEKCKSLSFSYSGYMDLLTDNEEDGYEDEYED